MLSWCPIKGPLPPGGYESRRGLLLVDFSVRGALDFEAKLHGYTAALGVGGFARIEGEFNTRIRRHSPQE